MIPIERISDIIDTYDKQGIHRSGALVDNASGEWLMAQIAAFGLTPIRDEFDFPLLNVKECHVTWPGLTKPIPAVC